MEINSLESQLTNIVNSTASTSSKPSQSSDQSQNIEKAVDAVAQEVEVFKALKAEGKEFEYLQSTAQAMNSFFKELDMDVSFKIEMSEIGYIVKMVNENGEVVKTIPSEQVVQTRQNIREMIKGIFEDKSR